MKSVFALAIAVLMAASSVAAEAPVQVTFTNRWKPDQKLNIEAGPPASTPVGADWTSAAWEVERTDDAKLFRIRNAWQGTYLDVVKGKLVAKAAKRDERSAMWRIEDVAEAPGHVRIRYAETGGYLNVESGTLTLGEIQPVWASAMWQVGRFGAKKP